jgi:hypothetical protein
MRGRSTWGIPAVFLALASFSLLAAPAAGKAVLDEIIASVSLAKQAGSTGSDEK